MTNIHRAENIIYEAITGDGFSAPELRIRHVARALADAGLLAPAPALPDGWRLAEHPDHGRGIVTNTTPDDDGHVCYVLPAADRMGFDWFFCDPDELTYLAQGDDTSDAVPENAMAAMIAGMREEWGVAVTYPGLAEVVEWGFDTRDGAEAEGSTLETEHRIVRRYVTTPEEA